MTELRIWLSRICSFLLTFLFGTFSACIPWKMAHLNMSETDLSFVILTFGIATIFSIQICWIVLIPKFGTIHLMPLVILLFSILFYFWTLSLDYLTFISLAIPARIFWGLWINNIYLCPSNYLDNLCLSNPTKAWKVN